MLFKVFFHHSLSTENVTVQSGSLRLAVWVTIITYKGAQWEPFPQGSWDYIHIDYPQHTHTHSAFIVFSTTAFYFLPLLPLSVESACWNPKSGEVSLLVKQNLSRLSFLSLKTKFF